MRRKSQIMVVLLIVLAFPFAAFAGNKSNGKPWDYKLGEGLRIADTSMRLGGYLAVEYEDATDEEEKFLFDDLSFFIFGDVTNKVRFFTEVENSRFAEVPIRGDADTDSRWQIERLYADYLYSENTNIRLGKFLTPVGRVNEIHADPLIPMATRPMVTEAAYPEYMTGAQLYGDVDIGGKEFSYNLAVQHNESIQERTGYILTERFYVLRGRWHISKSTEADMPFGYYKDEITEDGVYFTGYGFTHKIGRLTLESEGIYAYVDLKGGGNSRDCGYYLQGVYSITEKFFFGARHEFMRSGSSDKTLKAVSAGLTYKYVPQVVLKVEYQARYGNLVVPGNDKFTDSNRFLGTFSVLF